ncbi:MAG: DUF2069 domain-containing protein [Thiogranum sp.]|nr:DUF2069 domain-containing protein [Thiogranum sp.]
MNSTARLLYALTLSGYFGIMALLPLWYGWLAPPEVVSPAVAITLLGLPLFAPLRGLLHARRYTVAWSLFLSLLYFTHGIVEAWSASAARFPAILEILLSLLWLIAGIAFIRATRAVPAGTSDIQH